MHSPDYLRIEIAFGSLVELIGDDCQN